MSQVSYGTITIVDTTDIGRIYMVYAKSVSNTTPPSDELTWSESIASAPGEGDFIWQKTVVEKAITEEKTYSDPVCVTGSSGQGVEKIINYYCNYGQGQPEEDYSGWQLEIPEYDESKPNYWTKVVVIYSDDTREDFQASGTIATFENEKIGTLDSLEVSLSPIQDLHGYDKPWVGGAGKNKFNPQPYTGIGYNADIGATVTLTEALATFENNTISYTIEAWYNRVFRTPKLSQGSYTISMTNITITSPRVSVYEVSGTDNTIVGKSNYSTLPTDWNPTFSITESGNYFVLVIGSNTAQTISFSYPQIEVGSTKTTYEPWENICPISGWDEVDVSVSAITPPDNKRKASDNLFDGEYNEMVQLHIPSGTAVCVSALGRGVGFRYYDADKVEIDYWTLSTLSAGDGRYYRSFVTRGAKDVEYVLFYGEERTDYMVETGVSSPSSYVPHGTTYTTDLPQTVYGGTLDVVSGVLTVDRAMVDMGTLAWSEEVDGVYSTGALVGQIKEPLTNTEVPNILCSQYVPASYMQLWSQQIDGSTTVIWSASGAHGKVWARDSRFTDAQTFKTAMNGVQLVYDLATPTTIQCDPQTVQTLIGVNNVWGDGTVEVRGHTISKRDVMIYKDNGLTDVVNKSAEANTNAAEALEKANDGIVSTTQLWYQTNGTSAPSVPTSHNQVDQGTVTYNNWRSVRPNNSVNSYKYYYYCYEYLHGDGTYTYSAEAILDTSNLSQYQIDQLQVRIKKIWSNSTGSYMASGIGTNEVDIDDSSTYGFNSKSTTTGVSFNYNTIPLTSLGTDGIKLYSPTLTNGVITGSRLDATLNTNGLILNKGGIKAREGYSDFIYLSTDPYGNYSINGSTGIPDWKQIIGTKFGVRADGTLYASNANIQGILTAGAGSTIGPWSITATSIYKGSATHGAAGNGNMYFGDKGLSISNTFKVSSTGVLDATGARISGNLAATNGFTVAQGDEILTSITTNGMIIYDGVGSADPDNVVAKFTGNGVQVGKIGSGHVNIVSTGMQIYGYDNNYGETLLANIGYDIGVDSSGTETTRSVPYFILGKQVDMEDFEDVPNDWRHPSKIIYGENSFSQGRSLASGADSFAQGELCIASGYASHAEGLYAISDSSDSDAEFPVCASGRASHAEGEGSVASGRAAHAGGYRTQATGAFSFTSGDMTIAQGYSQTVIGRYNISSGSASYTRTDFPFIIGNGSDGYNRSNALTVDWDGNVQSYSQIADSSKTSYDAYDYNHNYAIIDKTGDTIGAVGNHTYANGAIGSFLTAGRTISGTKKWNSISVNIDNSGNRFYGITDPRAFCSALDLGETLSHEPAAITCATGKYMQLAYFTITPGTWLLMGSGQFPYVNTTGIRRIYMSTATSGYNNVTAGPASLAMQLYNNAAPISGNIPTYVNSGPMPITFTSNTIVRLIGFQNSGSNISVTGRIYAVRLA